MFISLNEIGKLGVIGFKNENIVKSVVNIIFSTKNKTLKNNCILFLMNISEKIEGFTSIVKHLMLDKPTLNQIFGVRCLFPLYL